MKMKVSVSLSEEVIKEIDKWRGIFNRSIFIEDLLWKQLKNKKREEGRGR